MTSPNHDQCIAFKHLDLSLRQTNAVRSDVLVMTPCGRPVEKRNGKHKSRFCPRHEQAFREILLGILEDGNSIANRER